jgi:membrane fusion protein, epimerase transport system
VELRRSLSELQMRGGEARAEIAKARQKRLDLELKAKVLTTDFAQAANNEWKLTSDRVEQFRAQLEPNSDAARRQNIMAPVAGRVVELHVNTIGAVISPRDTILEIVPDDAPLLVEGRLRTDAIAQIALGTEAGVRLLAFDQRTVPTLQGKVTYVSADRQLDKVNGAAYYTVNVEVPDSALKPAGIEALTPGMPAEIYFHAGKRTALSYLLDPFTLQRAMREK